MHCKSARMSIVRISFRKLSHLSVSIHSRPGDAFANGTVHRRNSDNLCHRPRLSCGDYIGWLLLYQYQWGPHFDRVTGVRF
jgi:hypothetical protein